MGVERFKAGPRVRQRDSEDTLRFSELTGVRPMIEKYPLERASEAYARILSGKAEFRVVLIGKQRLRRNVKFAVDTIALMDALKIDRAILAGYDYDGRAADIVAVL